MEASLKNCLGYRAHDGLDYQRAGSGQRNDDFWHHCDSSLLCRLSHQAHAVYRVRLSAGNHCSDFNVALHDATPDHLHRPIRRSSWKRLPDQTVPHCRRAQWILGAWPRSKHSKTLFPAGTTYGFHLCRRRRGDRLSGMRPHRAAHRLPVSSRNENFS